MRKVLIFAVVFSLLNLGFVPLMALYGLSICPILRGPGFFFGCAYAGTFISSVLVTNFLLLFFLTRSTQGKLRWPYELSPVPVYVLSYAVATVISLVFLDWLFALNHISGDSRAPEILALTSLVLCVTQAYGLSWALGDRYPGQAQRQLSFNRSWLQHSVRTMAPVVIAVGILTHFVLIQSFLQGRGDVAQVRPDDLLTQAKSIILFIVVWLSITYFFHFMSEKENALRINQHLKMLEAGDFEYRTKNDNAWGLWASLARYMNDFSTAFAQRTKLLKSFSRFVTSEVAQQALQTEITEVGGRQEELTVLMSDIREFTRLSSELSPDAVVRLLNDYFTVMLDEMVQHSLTIDKFIGDGILAYVDGATRDPAEENRRAVAAALGMLARLEDFNATGSPRQLRIGLGICRGPLIKGYIGSLNKLQHTIIGDTVNRAARLESLCKDLGVALVISEDVWRTLPPEQQELFRFFPNVKVKGIAEAVPVYGLRSMR